MKKEHKRIIRAVKGARGVERERHFQGGGSLVSWRGGPRLVVQDKKKKQNKRACRGKVREHAL